MPTLKILLWAAFLLAAVPATHGQRVTISECARMISPDTLSLYFDQEYRLAATECAVIRRVGRATANGNFYGLVSDYRTSDGTLLAQFTYRAGKMEGPATLYFAHGLIAAQGLILQGKQNGDWSYWYPGGKPRQVLRFLPMGEPRIMAYWDSTGQQLATNGQGRWRGRSSFGLLAEGPISLGLPTGTWTGYHAQSHQPITTELYESGVFRRGRLLHPQADELPTYQAIPLLTPRESSPYLQAQQLVLGYTCAESLRQAQFQLIQDDFQLPSVKIGVIRYADRLAQRLVRYRETHWYASLPTKTVVRCTLDQQGNFTAFNSANPALREVVRSLVKMLPPWQPARYQNNPVLGYLDIILDKTTSQVRVTPAARLLTSQLPIPNFLTWP